MTNQKKKISSILFVCTGNSCRSVMAEALMRKKLYELGSDRAEVGSAGVAVFGSVPPTGETIAVMREEGVDVSGSRTKKVTRDMIRNADLILVMEPAHKDKILNLDPQASGKTFLLREYKNPSKVMPGGFGVHDPIGMPVEGYRKTRDEIKKEIERIAGEI